MPVHCSVVAVVVVVVVVVVVIVEMAEIHTVEIVEMVEMVEMGRLSPATGKKFEVGITDYEGTGRQKSRKKLGVESTEGGPPAQHLRTLRIVWAQCTTSGAGLLPVGRNSGRRRRRREEGEGWMEGGLGGGRMEEGGRGGRLVQVGFRFG